jgi:hypothetical protein
MSCSSFLMMSTSFYSYSTHSSHFFWYISLLHVYRVTISIDFRFFTNTKLVNQHYPCITDRGEGGLSSLHGRVLLHAWDSTVIYITMNMTGYGSKKVGERGIGRIEGSKTGYPLLILCFIQTVINWQKGSNRCSKHYYWVKIQTPLC